MTVDWKQRAIIAENKLEEARADIRAFYNAPSSAEAIKALLRLCNTLDVVIERKPGVPEHVTREVDYVVLNSR